eukprot:scaffold1570_cov76-Skeletonema_marinoi.AAC.1
MHGVARFARNFLESSVGARKWAVFGRKNALAEQNLTHKEAWRYCSSRRKNNGNRAAPVGNKQWKKRLYTFSIDNSKQQYSRSCLQ